VIITGLIPARAQVRIASFASDGRVDHPNEAEERHLAPPASGR
jgi:hypothetical protein